MAFTRTRADGIWYTNNLVKGTDFILSNNNTSKLFIFYSTSSNKYRTIFSIYDHHVSIYKSETSLDEKKLQATFQYANTINNKVNEFIQYSSNKDNCTFGYSENFKHHFWLELMRTTDSRLRKELYHSAMLNPQIRYKNKSYRI